MTDYVTVPGASFAEKVGEPFLCGGVRYLPVRWLNTTCPSLSVADQVVPVEPRRVALTIDGNTVAMHEMLLSCHADGKTWLASSLTGQRGTGSSDTEAVLAALRAILSAPEGKP